MTNPRELAKELMRPYALKGWQLGDQKFWDCEAYKARMGKLTIPPYDYAIVILRIKSCEYFDIFRIVNLLQEIRSEQEERQLLLW